jgi:2-C-methyl-D-erythritol 2,4-cyclodiphosphate synthase
MSTPVATRPRIGVGFDIHALAPGDHVVLGGVRIAHSQGIKAHSDGDVAIHALCDALLGALALGDIGHYFPPTDERWRGVDSRELLRQCRRLLTQHGYEVGNADISVIAEAPKLAPHVALMRTRLAEDLAVAEDCISVKATTNEKLDAIGRAEGIAAHAVVLLFPKATV